MKILIIKLGAKGDVIRTLSILPAFKKNYPESEIYWITKKENMSVLEGNPYLKEVCSSHENLPKYFDSLYNFDIEDEALRLAKSISAESKFGFYKEEEYPAAYNLGAEYYLNTLFDDGLKKENKKTYQEMIFEAAELKFKGEHCPIYLSTEEKKQAKIFAEKLGIKIERLIGIHMGASPRWPSKSWHKEEIIKFVEEASGLGYDVILFAGKNEAEDQKEILDYFYKRKIRFFHNNPQNSDREFCSLVDLCKVIVCSDSFSLHVSLALKKQTIGLFFCTSPNEIEGYGILKKIVAPRLMEFFPEKMDKYDEKLVKSISYAEVLKEVNKIFKI